MTKSEYFNVLIEYSVDENTPLHIKRSVPLIAFSQGDIKKYFQLVENAELGEKPIRNKLEKVVKPSSFRIFDFSKLNFGKNRGVYFEEVKQKVKVLDDYLEVFRQLGEDVTDSFDIELKIILQKYEQNKGAKSAKDRDAIKKIIGESSNITGKIPEEKKTNKKSIVKKDKIDPIFPNEFKDGILNNSISPAFNVKEISKVFADHLKNLEREDGQMVGVFGQWGRGKTYFINHILKQFKLDSIKKGKSKAEHFTLVKFQAWRYQSTPSIWAYLYETFMRSYLSVPFCKKLSRVVELNIERKGHWRSWVWPLLGIIFGIIWFFVFDLSDKFSWLNSLIKYAGGGLAFLIFLVKMISFIRMAKNPATTIFNTISSIPSFNSVLGLQAEIQKELSYLIKAWGRINNGKRLLIFIDDLDRCSERKLINIIDSLRVMLDDEEINKYLLILVALDEDKLKIAIKSKYKQIEEEGNNTKLASEYIDKLFISAIKLFPITSSDRKEFVNKLSKQINTNDREESVETKTSQETNIKSEEPKESDNEQKVQPSDTTVSEKKKTLVKIKEADEVLINLNDDEIKLIEREIGLIKKDITPRQIRIFIYRYLLARNIWRTLFDELKFSPDDAISEILRFSGFNDSDQNDGSEINSDLSAIAQMVVAY